MRMPWFLPMPPMERECTSFFCVRRVLLAVAMGHTRTPIGPGPGSVPGHEKGQTQGGSFGASEATRPLLLLPAGDRGVTIELRALAAPGPPAPLVTMAERPCAISWFSARFARNTPGARFTREAAGANVSSGQSGGAIIIISPACNRTIGNLPGDIASNGTLLSPRRPKEGPAGHGRPLTAFVAVEVGKGGRGDETQGDPEPRLLNDGGLIAVPSRGQRMTTPSGSVVEPSRGGRDGTRDHRGSSSKLADRLAS